MKTSIKIIGGIIIFALLITNIIIFNNGIKLAVEITNIEKELSSLKQSNLELEKELSRLVSLEYVATMAAQLGLDHKTEPIFLDNLKYALNR